jgi:hypothetical protein
MILITPELPLTQAWTVSAVADEAVRRAAAAKVPATMRVSPARARTLVAKFVLVPLLTSGARDDSRRDYNRQVLTMREYERAHGELTRVVNPIDTSASSLAGCRVTERRAGRGVSLLQTAKPG